MPRLARTFSGCALNPDYLLKKKAKTTMVMLGTADPWESAAGRLNYFARMDRSLAGKLNQMSQDQSDEDKLAWALESGRVYGLRTQECDMLLKRQLNKDWAKAPTEASW